MMRLSKTRYYELYFVKTTVLMVEIAKAYYISAELVYSSLLKTETFLR